MLITYLIDFIASCEMYLQSNRTSWTTVETTTYQPFGGYFSNTPLRSLFMISTTNAISPSKNWRIQVNCGSSQSSAWSISGYSRVNVFAVTESVYGLYYLSTSSYSSGAQTLAWSSSMSSGITINGDNSFTFAYDGTYVIELKLRSTFTTSSGVCVTSLQYNTGGSSYSTFQNSEYCPYGGYNGNSEIQASFMLTTNVQGTRQWRIQLNCESSNTWTSGIVSSSESRLQVWLIPSAAPTTSPTHLPTYPTVVPSYKPSVSLLPSSLLPSNTPSMSPTVRPSTPTRVPIRSPTRFPVSSRPSFAGLDSWVHLSTTGLPKRFIHTSVFDQSTNSILTIGGSNGIRALNDTWSFDIVNSK